MKTKLLLIFLGAFALALLPLLAMAQAVDTTGIAENPFPGGTASVGKLVDMYNILYGALVIVWGYVGKVFRLDAKVPHYVLVVLAGGIVLAIGFVMLGFSSVFPLIFSFLSAIGVYDLVFKPVTRALVANPSNVVRQG